MIAMQTKMARNSTMSDIARKMGVWGNSGALANSLKYII
jgi:hypothetical protein